MELLRRTLQGFFKNVFGKNGFYFAFSVVWAVSLSELIFGQVPNFLRQLSLWIVVILGGMALVGALLNFVKE